MARAVQRFAGVVIGVAIAGIGVAVKSPALVRYGLGMAVTTAIGVGLQEILPKPKSSQPLREQTIISNVAALPIVYGKARLGGTLCYFNIGGEWAWAIYALAHGPVASIDEVYFDGNIAFEPDGRVRRDASDSAPVSLGANDVCTPCYITCGNDHGLYDGDTVLIESHGAGCDGTWTVTRVSSTVFSIPTTASSVLSGGTAKRQNKGYADADGANAIVGIGKYLGTATQTTGGTGRQAGSGIMASDLTAIDASWKSTAYGRYVAYIIVRLKVTDDRIPQLPNITAVVRGIRCDDPDQPSAVNISTVTPRNFTTLITTGTTHGLVPGDWVDIASNTSTTDLNRNWEVQEVLSFTQFRIGCVTTGAANNGTVRRTRLANAALCQRDYMLSTLYGWALPSTDLFDGASVAEGMRAEAAYCDEVVNAPSIRGRFTIASATASTDVFATPGVHTLVDGQTVWLRSVPTVTDGAYVVNSSNPAAKTFKLTGVNVTSDSSGQGTVQLTQQARRYEAHGLVNTAADILSNTADLSTASRAVPLFEYGRYRLFSTRAASPSTEFELNEDTMVGDWQFALAGSKDTPNQIRARIIDAAQGFVDTDIIWPPTTATNPYLVADNNYLSELRIDLPFTTSRSMAERLLNTALEEARADISLSAGAMDKALALAVFDVVNVRHRTPGWGPSEANAKAITSSSVDSPTVITATAHGFQTGDRVRIIGHVNSTPALSGDYVATRLSADTFSIPVNVTVGGTGGVAAPSPKRFWVTGVEIRPDFTVGLTGREYKATAYDDIFLNTQDYLDSTTLQSPFYVEPPTYPTGRTDILSNLTGGDPRLIVQWTKSQHANVTSYRLEAKRTATGVNGRPVDGDWRLVSYFAATEEVGYVFDVDDGETWDVRVCAETSVGRRSAFLTQTGFVASVSLTPTVSLTSHTPGSAGVTYIVAMGGNTEYVEFFTLEDASSTGTPPETSEYSAGYLRRGATTKFIATTTGKYRHTLIVPYTKEWIRGTALAVANDLCSAGGSPPADPLTFADTSVTTTTATCAYTNDAVGGGVKNRMWLNGAIVQPDAGLSPYVFSGLEPDTSYEGAFDHYDPSTGLASAVKLTRVFVTTKAPAGPTTFVWGDVSHVWLRGHYYTTHHCTFANPSAKDWEVYETAVNDVAQATYCGSGSGGTDFYIEHGDANAGPFYYWIRYKGPNSLWVALDTNATGGLDFGLA